MVGVGVVQGLCLRLCQAASARLGVALNLAGVDPGLAGFLPI